jgi:hypothetical protein
MMALWNELFMRYESRGMVVKIPEILNKVKSSMD